MNLFYSLLISTGLMFQTIPSSYSVTTIAGIGRIRFSGDGGPAVAARFNGIAALAVDDSGNVYIADSQNQRIRKVNAQGAIQTVAGTGKKGTGASSSRAFTTDLFSPRGLAVDNSGNLYIADTFSHVVRKVNSSGDIATVAGFQWYVMGSDTLRSRGQKATAIRLAMPREIAVDSSGNLFITVWSHKVVSKVTPEGVTSVAAGTVKNDADQLADSDKENAFDPDDIVVDSQSRLFVDGLIPDDVRRNPVLP